ncbi:Transmembrane domain-containing protein [Cedratvirus Zaza IHUMI]|uniref:Transmembrane domain-containing protein n=1 Tax=Cedratvirus Zaza IHUMI TaxID=2126979 RepID=A0A2R8FDZ6_9VIRU|nr:Transmembrane domain-containing protein [Cedratvirus Zaza IHUMI]
MSTAFAANSYINPLLTSTTLTETAASISSSREQGFLPFIFTLLTTFISILIIGYILYYTFRSSRTETQRRETFYVNLGMITSKTFTSSTQANVVSWDTFYPNVYDKTRNRVLVTRNGICDLSFAFSLLSRDEEPLTLYLRLGNNTIPFLYTPVRGETTGTLAASVKLPVREEEEIYFYLVPSGTVTLLPNGTFVTLTVNEQA